MRQSSHRARGILLFGQLLSAVLFVAPWTRSFGFPLDDAWIHHVIARTFATTGTLGYHAGAHGSGATSYLWASLLAIGHLVGANPVVFTSVLGACAALTAGQFLLELVAGDEPIRLHHVALTLLACAGGDFTWFSFSGMEATLVVALSLGAIAMALRAEGHPAERRAAWTAGILAGLSALARPDFVPLGALLAALLCWRRRKLAGALPIAVPWLFACLLYFGSNAILTGQPMPATLRGRRWLWIDSTEVHPTAIRLALDFAFAWAYRLRQFTLGTSADALFWVTAGLAGAGLCAAVRERRRGLLLTVAWTGLHVLLFVVVLPVPGHGGRYQPLVPVVFVVLAAYGLSRVVAAMAERARISQGRAAGISLAGFAIVMANAWWEWRGAHRDAVTHVRLVEEATGSFVRDLPKDARIASFDVGAIGYFSGRKLLDLGALTDPRVVDVLRRDAVAELLREERISHLVLPSGEEGTFPDLSNFGFRLHVVDHPGIALETLATFHSDPKTWLRGVWFTQNATYRQIIHRVAFTDCRPSDLDVAGAAAWIVEGLSGDLDRIRDAYATSAKHGLCVRAHSSPGAEAASGCFAVDLRKGELVAWPPYADAHAAAAKEHVKSALAPYVRVGDRRGAALVTLHALSRFVREKIAPCFWSPLPPLEKPLPERFKPPSTPSSTAFWGLPLSILTLAAALRARRAK